MKQSRMQSLSVWATEVEIIAAASLSNATIYAYAQSYVEIHVSG